MSAEKPIKPCAARRMLLIALDWTNPKDPPLSIGHASIFANLRKNGIDSLGLSWSVNIPGFSPDDVVACIMRHDDDNTDIGLGVFVWNEDATQHIIKSLGQKGFRGNIVLGGPQISYLKAHPSVHYPRADIFIRGHGEEVLAKLYNPADRATSLNAFDRDIPGVVYRGRPDMATSAVADLESLPSPYLTGLIQPQRFIRWETQRGCPFRCSFCQFPGRDGSVRKDMSLSRVMEEARWITGNSLIQYVSVVDPIFNVGRNHLQIMDALIEGGYAGKLSLEVRPELVTEEFLDKTLALNRTGRVVYEFGLQTIHKAEWRIINRGNNMRKINRALDATRARGIETEATIIFGLPNQTVDSFGETIAFCKGKGVKRIYAFPLMLLRGTPLYERKESLGLIEDSDAKIIDGISRVGEGISHVVQSPSFTYKEWRIMSRMAADLERYNALSPDPEKNKKDGAGSIAHILEPERIVANRPRLAGGCLV